MRHKYETHALILSRSPLGEANALVTLLTPDLGLVRARAQGVRAPGAKLAAALTTFSESEVVLVRGKEQWRVAGAILQENWFIRLSGVAARTKAIHVTGLLLRLVTGEAHDPELFMIMKEFFNALATFPEDRHDAVEVLTVLRLLKALGFDAGKIVEAAAVTTPELLAEVERERASYIARINRGISASGL